ncbi:pyridoxal phosphate-dependent aminotransferase, partial [Streptomyces zhihengii]
SLRVRLATSRLYGADDGQRLAALAAPDPLALPWIAGAVAWAGEALADLAAGAGPAARRP